MGLILPQYDIASPQFNCWLKTANSKTEFQVSSACTCRVTSLGVCQLGWPIGNKGVCLLALNKRAVCGCVSASVNEREREGSKNRRKILKSAIPRRD